MTQLFAISDLHVDYKENLTTIHHIIPHPNDYLIIAGDITHNTVLFKTTLTILTSKFKQVFWVPGNHDLWVLNSDSNNSIEKYNTYCTICETLNVNTPKTPYVTINTNNQSFVIALCNTLYDYSFRPDNIPKDMAIEWAKESHVFCADEHYIKPAPFESISDWCHDQVIKTEQKLKKHMNQHIILVNHYPIHQDILQLFRIPRFSIWSGTTKTEHWFDTYPIHTHIFGHSHIRNSRSFKNANCHEVSFGYPSQHYYGNDINDYLVHIALE